MKASPILLASLLLIAGSAAAQQGPPFGRLFHTPAERQRLDRDGTLTPAPEPEVVEQAPRRLDGVIRRSDGRSTVWVDGRIANRDEARAAGDARAAVIALPDGSRRRLRVGESTAAEDE